MSKNKLVYVRTKTWLTNQEDDSFVLEVNLTEEGVIFDAYAFEQHQGTLAMTGHEWFEHIIDLMCLHCGSKLLTDSTTLLDLNGETSCPREHDGEDHYHCYQYEAVDDTEQESACCNCGMFQAQHDKGE